MNSMIHDYWNMSPLAGVALPLIGIGSYLGSL